LVSAGIASVFGTTGDFMESYLKRRAGVKDSGTVLPGHGGILDRFDAYLLAIPVMVFYLYGSA
ncbi:MAG: phosphatidate cytidylyltransferase, partial [Flavobacteriales bacterium]|nr:phosphatidate cytidylyltransferase [Flavobacteriales bacterium]